MYGYFLVPPKCFPGFISTPYMLVPCFPALNTSFPAHHAPPYSPLFFLCNVNPPPLNFLSTNAKYFKPV